VQLPANSTWKSFASVCMLCGIGFTVSMFMADLSYRPVNELGMLADSKLGILCGSIASALIGAFLLNKHLPKEASETDTK
jgi:NhaA family Na+:H+ antiporter